MYFLEKNSEKFYEKINKKLQRQLFSAQMREKRNTYC